MANREFTDPIQSQIHASRVTIEMWRVHLLKRLRLEMRTGRRKLVHNAEPGEARL